ncbi:MAG: omptin family outer membrane protease [Spirochaetaceae bacterium]|nr:omptin family outer membrane protease [Spirochaetaceae bacterium]
MKNKFISVCLAIIISTFPTFAKDIELKFSLTPNMGLKFGSVGEYVFCQDSTEQGMDFSHVPDGYKQISYLAWDVQPLCTIGLNTSLNINDFYLGIEFATGFHSESGKMEDFDWLGPKGVLTRYSCHNNKITNYFFSKFFFGWNSFVEEKKIFWTTTLGIEFEQLGFISTDGFKQYVPNDNKEWTSDIEKVSMQGDIISYSQNSLLLNFSNKVSWLIMPKFILCFTFDIKPILIYEGHDTHFKRNLDFFDSNMNGTIPLGLAIGTEYQLTNLTWFYFEIGGDWIPVSNGEVYTKDSSEEYFYPDPFSSSGGSKWLAGIKAGIRINI